MEINEAIRSKYATRLNRTLNDSKKADDINILLGLDSRKSDEGRPSSSPELRPNSRQNTTF